MRKLHHTELAAKRSILKSEKGFGLVQVMVSAGILGVMAVAFSSLVSEQIKATGFLEDQISKLSLTNELLNVFSNPVLCAETLENVRIGNANQRVNFSLKDSTGKVLYDANTGVGKFDKLNIRAQITNVNVPATGPSGMAKAIVTVNRERKGGGPSELSPIEFNLGVTTNPTLAIISCSTGTQSGGCVGPSGEGYSDTAMTVWGEGEEYFGWTTSAATAGCQNSGEIVAHKHRFRCVDRRPVRISTGSLDSYVVRAGTNDCNSGPN